MEIFHSIAVARLIFILGIFNLVTGLALFFSCRCIPNMKLAQRLRKTHLFTRLLKIHCYIWYVFWPSVVIHATLAILFFGVPF